MARAIKSGGGSEYSSVEKARKEQIKRDLAAQKKRIAAKKKIGKAKKKKAASY